MEYILPTELARLVYGYLLLQKCEDVAKMFLERSPLMKECLDFEKKGRKFCTKFMGASLDELVDRVVEAAVFVENELTSPEVPRRNCLTRVKSILLGRDLDDPTVLRVLAKKNHVDAATSTEDLDEAGRRAFESLLCNKEFHERLAENINKVYETGEGEESSKTGVDVLLERKMLETIVDNTEKDPIFERMLEELVGPEAATQDSGLNANEPEETPNVTETIIVDDPTGETNDPPVDMTLSPLSKPGSPVQDETPSEPVSVVKSPDSLSPSSIVANSRVLKPIQLKILTRVPAVTTVANSKTFVRVPFVNTSLPTQRTSSIVTRSSKILTSSETTLRPLAPRPPPGPIVIDVLDDDVTQNSSNSPSAGLSPSNSVSSISRTGVRARGGKRLGRGARNLKVHVPKVKPVDASAKVEAEGSDPPLGVTRAADDIRKCYQGPRISSNAVRGNELPAEAPQPNENAVLETEISSNCVPSPVQPEEPSVITSQECVQPEGDNLSPPSDAQEPSHEKPVDLSPLTTPLQTVCGNILKGQSLSTPRKKSHIRALEFGSPSESAPAKCLTSPKGCRSSPPLNLDKIKRAALFKSPEKKPDAQRSSTTVSWDAALRKCLSQDDTEEVPASVDLQRTEGSRKKSASSKKTRSSSLDKPPTSKKLTISKKKSSKQPKSPKRNSNSSLSRRSQLRKAAKIVSSEAGSSTPELSIISEEEEKLVEQNSEEQPTDEKDPSITSKEAETTKLTPPSTAPSQPVEEIITPLKAPDLLSFGFDPNKTPFMTPISKIIHDETSSILQLLTPSTLMTPTMNRNVEFDINSMTNSPGALERALIRECHRIEQGETPVVSPSINSPFKPDDPSSKVDLEINRFLEKVQRNSSKVSSEGVQETDRPISTLENSQSQPSEPPCKVEESPPVVTDLQKLRGPVILVETPKEPRKVASPLHDADFLLVDPPIILDSSEDMKTALINKCMSFAKSSLYSGQNDSSATVKKKKSRNKSKCRDKSCKSDEELKKPATKKKKKTKIILSSSSEEGEISSKSQSPREVKSTVSSQETVRPVDAGDAAPPKKLKDSRKTGKTKKSDEKSGESTLAKSPVHGTDQLGSSSQTQGPKPAQRTDLGSSSQAQGRNPQVSCTVTKSSPSASSETPRTRASAPFADFSLSINCSSENGLIVQRLLKMSPCFDLFDLPRDVRSVFEPTTSTKAKEHASRPVFFRGETHPADQIHSPPKKRKRNHSLGPTEDMSKPTRIDLEERKTEEKEFKRRSRIIDEEEASESVSRRRHDRPSGSHREFIKNRDYDRARHRYDRRSRHSPTSSPPHSSSSRRYSGRPSWAPPYHRSHRHSNRDKKSPHRMQKEKFHREEHKPANVKREPRDVLEIIPSHSSTRDGSEEGEITESSMTPAIQFKTNDVKITVESNRLLCPGEDTKALLKRVDLEKFLSLLHGSANSK